MYISEGFTVCYIFMRPFGPTYQKIHEYDVLYGITLHIPLCM